MRGKIKKIFRNKIKLRGFLRFIRFFAQLALPLHAENGLSLFKQQDYSTREHIWSKNLSPKRLWDWNLYWRRN